MFHYKMWAGYRTWTNAKGLRMPRSHVDDWGRERLCARLLARICGSLRPPVALQLLTEALYFVPVPRAWATDFARGAPFAVLRTSYFGF